MQTLSVEKGLVIQNRREVVKKVEADEDLKILARIRSKERMQATRNRRKKEHVKQSGTRSNSTRESCGQSKTEFTSQSV
ncbi:hypothetical protein TNCT_327871 [Trichonephila clavata]|uniref:Uncharacterized protein n=1 Tax=Trichonephila clavata TaxID=2740835 RepID=A0A8X6FEM7_TRICU|nr:hypothetical protein TNCT_327871 [Trichonephila clavata]